MKFAKRMKYCYKSLTAKGVKMPMKWHVYWNFNVVFLLLGWRFCGKLRIVNRFVDSAKCVFICTKYKEDMQYNCMSSSCEIYCY